MSMSGLVAPLIGNLGKVLMNTNFNAFLHYYYYETINYCNSQTFEKKENQNFLLFDYAEGITR